MTLLNRGAASLPPATASTVTATWTDVAGDPATPVDGSTLVMIHRYHAGPAAATTPAGWTSLGVIGRSTFITMHVLTRVADSEGVTQAVGTTGVGNVRQEVAVLAYPEGAGVDLDTIVFEDSGGSLNNFTVGPSPSLDPGTKALVAAVGVVNAPTTWTGIPSGYQKLVPESDLGGQMSVAVRNTETGTDSQSANFTWDTNTGACGVLLAVHYDPVVISALPWRYMSAIPWSAGVPPPVGEVVKAATPIYRDQLAWYSGANLSVIKGVSQAAWNQIASWYRYGHMEGHNFSQALDSDGTSPAGKFENGRETTHRVTLYDNGSYVTQGRPWEPFRVAAHAERISPLGLADLHIATPATLASPLAETATSVSILLPTQKPTGLPATHPAGNPAADYWPFIASTIDPATPDVFSKSTSQYVSSIRVDDERIGLPTWTGGGTSPQAPQGPDPSPRSITSSQTGSRVITTSQGEAVEVRYPIVGGQMAQGRPVVYVGHGQGMGDNMAGVMQGGQFLVNAGYVIIAANIDTPSSYLGKAQKVSRAITALLADPVMAPGILPQRIGYYGGSQGAITAVALQDPSVRDDRIRCFVARSPMNSGSSPSWSDAMPFFVMLGTADAIIPPSLSRGIYTSATSPKGKIELEGAGHNMTLTGSNIVQDASRAFFDRFLRGNPTGLDAIPPLIAADSRLAYESNWTLDAGSGSSSYSLNAAKTVLTINNVRRGMFRTERRAHTTGATVWSNQYVGSNAATEADKPLSGNPIVNSTGGLRYALSWWDRDRRNGDYSYLTVGHDSLRVIADVGTMEQQGAQLHLARNVVSVSDDGTITTDGNHGYSNGHRVMFGGTTLAPGLTAIKNYFVRDVTATTLRVAETAGGLALEPAKPPRIWAGGAWLLQQINTRTQWNTWLTKMSQVLDEPSCVGLSMRMSWDAYEADPGILDLGYDLAVSKGKKFTIRFMAGEHTPSRVFASGAYSFQSNLGTDQQPRMATIPQPFAPDGTGGNPVFESNYEALVAQLAAWCRARGIRLMHSAWYGWKWSEFYNGSDLVARPGYSWENGALEGHRRLKRIDRKYADYGLAIEHSLSGHAEDPAVDEWRDLITMLVSVFGPDSEALMTQGNNMNDQSSNLGYPNPDLFHAKQSVSSTINTYNWDTIFDAYEDRGYSYIEIYTDQWFGGTSATLKSRALQVLPDPVDPFLPDDMVVTRLLRAPSDPVSDGIELDVTAPDQYNVSDTYGNDVRPNQTPAIGGFAWSHITKQRVQYAAAQLAKRAPLQQLFTERGLPSLMALVANNALAQPAAVPSGERMDFVASNVYDHNLFEHGSMEPGSLVAQITQLCQIHGGLNSAGVQVNPGGHKGVWWLKWGDWKGGVFSAANGAQYNRLGFGMFWLTWRSTSVNPVLQGRFFTNSITERPHDGAGHEMFFWDFGVPTTQPGGKPINPNSAADVYQPTAGLYLRKFTKGLILVNTTSTAKTYTLPEPHYNALSEVNGDGNLTHHNAGTQVTVPAYDFGFYLLDATGSTVQAPTNFSVSTVTQTSVSTSWSPVAGATGYEVRLNGGSVTTASGTTHTFSGLTAGTSYTAEVRTVQGPATSAWVLLPIQTAPATTLAAPTGLVASDITSTEARITWNAVTGAIGYQIRVNGGTNSPVGGTTRLLTGLTPGAAHNVEVRAVAGTTVGPWATIQVTTLAANPDLALKIGGVWLLQQSTSASSNYLTQMRTAFTTVPSSVGFGLRFPLDQVIDANGDLITASTGLLTRHAEAVKTINTERGRNYRLSLRPVAGQHVPDAWTAGMPAQFTMTDATLGLTGIHPCYTEAVTSHQHDGLPPHSHEVGDPNDYYEVRWERFLQQLFAWRENNGYQELIPFVHGAYYALEWSEYYYGTAAQAATYTSADHRAAHLRLATIMHQEQPADVVTEWAATGRGPMVGTWHDGNGVGAGDNPFIEDMVEHLVSLYGPGSDRVVFSLNGWRDDRIAGAPDAEPFSEYNKQYAIRTDVIRLELQDIAANWVGPWAAPFEWAYPGGSAPDDTLGAYTSAFPVRRTLGKGYNGGADAYRTRGVVPVEVYMFRAIGSTGNALYSAQLEQHAAAHRAHIVSKFS